MHLENLWDFLKFSLNYVSALLEYITEARRQVKTASTLTVSSDDLDDRDESGSYLLFFHEQNMLIEYIFI